MPIYLFVAEEDKLCPKSQALWISEQIGEAIREVRLFEGQGHGYFVDSVDFILVMSLLYTLRTDEDVVAGNGIHEHWEALEINQEIGFAPHFMENKVDISEL